MRHKSPTRHQRPKSPYVRHPYVHPKPVSPTMFPGCPSGGTVSVPHIKYTLHQKPVIFEKVSKCITQNQVPITYEYEKKQHPVKVVKSPCSPCGRSRKIMSPHFGHIKTMSWLPRSPRLRLPRLRSPRLRLPPAP